MKRDLMFLVLAVSFFLQGVMLIVSKHQTGEAQAQARQMADNFEKMEAISECWRTNYMALNERYVDLLLTRTNQP